MKSAANLIAILAFVQLSCARWGFMPPCESDADCTGGDLCSGQERCERGVCVPGEPLECDDGLYCNGEETCDPEAGCLLGEAPCPGPDGDSDCAESCDEEADACTAYDPEGTSCADDGLYCSGSEECRSGSCVSAGNPCPVPDECNEGTDMCAGCGDGAVGAGEDCDPSAGDNCCGPSSCHWVPAGQPDPQAVCTGAPECRLDVCNGSGSCTQVNDADGSACTDDQLFCTGAERCLSGACLPEGNPCPQPDDCDEDADICAGCGDGEVGAGEDCDPAAGDNCCHPATCQFVPAGQPDPQAICAGAPECQLDVCDGSGGCALVDADDGSACTDDLLFCTGLESCLDGACVSAGDPCTGPDGDADCSESCDEAADDCSGADPGDTICDDGLYCNGNDSCDAVGSCSAHTGDPCGGPECDEVLDTCLDEPWFDLGGSDFGPWSVRIGGGSFWGGGISESSGASVLPSLAIDSLGYPVIAWQDNYLGTAQIYVKGYDPAGLSVEVGAGSATGPGMSGTNGRSWQPSLALDTDYHPVVAWQDDTSGNFEIYVRRFDGADWIPMGALSDISNNSGASQAPSLALDGGGNPVVAWQDDSSGGSNEIYVKRFLGGVWEDVEAGSSSGGGISSNVGESMAPALVLDDSDNPLVAWHDDSSGDFEIYLKAFDGNTWVDVGPLSSSAGGISDNDGSSLNPSLALDAAFNPLVAWQDDSPANEEIYIKRFEDPNWVDAGTGSSSGYGISSNEGASQFPSLSMDDAGNPVVAWHDDTAGLPEILARRLEGNSWVEVLPGSSSGPGISDTGGTSNNPVMAYDRNGYPLVAWHDSTSGNNEIYAKKSNGSAWVDVGAGSQIPGALTDNDGVSVVPAVVQDVAGNPVVSWHDESPGNFEIYVTGYDGSAWAEFGPGSASGAGVSGNAGKSAYTSLALGPGGNPVVAWYDETTGPAQIYVKEFSTTLEIWVEVGSGSASGLGISDTPGWSMNPSMALDGQGYPVVAWQDGSSGNTEIYVKRYDGNGWVELGAGSADGGGISSSIGASRNPWLALNDLDDPVVVWWDDTFGNSEIYVKMFDSLVAGAWVEVGSGSATDGGISGNAGESSYPKIIMNGSFEPVVAWMDNTPGRYEIYVRKFDGLNWVEVGPGSASGLGVSGNPGQSSRPDLAVDSLGNPLVAWHDEFSGNYEIYLKRFDGGDPGNWEEVAGSASGGGISNSAAQSSNASVSVSGSRTCVAWFEVGMNSVEIVLRCSDE